MNKLLYSLLLIAILLESCIKDNLISTQSQLKLDTLSISRFLTQHSIPAEKAASGYWYIIDTLATGVYPVLSDSIKISYRTKSIPDLIEVDSVIKSTTVLLSGAISGIQQGLLKFPSGSYGRLFIPSGLAFGANVHSHIPPNSNLVYEIKLIAVKGTRLANDIATIDAYLQNSSIIPQEDPSGIRYVINSIDSTAQNPAKPIISDSIKFTYRAKILATNPAVDSITLPIARPLKDQIAAWKIILPQIAEGDSITMYVPSGYGYGSNVIIPAIPPNSNLVYTLKLIKVIHH